MRLCSVYGREKSTSIWRGCGDRDAAQRQVEAPGGRVRQMSDAHDVLTNCTDRPSSRPRSRARSMSTPTKPPRVAMLNGA